MIYTPLPSFDPQAVVDNLDSTFVFDTIPLGDAIASATVVANPIDLQVSDVTFNAGSVTCWLTGGTASIIYTLTATIVTTSGREMARSATVAILPLPASFPVQSPPSIGPTGPTGATGPTGPSVTRSRLVVGDMAGGVPLVENTYLFNYNPDMLDVFIYVGGQQGVKLLFNDVFLPYTATNGTSIVFADITATQIFVVEFISWL